MLKNKLRKIKSKKILLYPFVLLFMFMVTLAFIPHYSCGCGDEGNNKKVNGSLLRHYAIETAENIAKAIRPIFN